MMVFECTEYHYQVWAGRIRGQIRCVYSGTEWLIALTELRRQKQLGYIAQLDRWTFNGGTERLAQDLQTWERV